MLPLTRRSNRLLLACTLLMGMLLAGCANVHFEQGPARLEDKALVFGKIVVVRSGEVATLRPSAVPLQLATVLSGAEPLMVTESFGPDGSFYWQMAPGSYLLNVTLNGNTGEALRLAFTVPAAGKAWYLGDHAIVGNYRFNTIGGANIVNAQLRSQDNFAAARAALEQRNPGLGNQAAPALAVSVAEPQAWRQMLRDALDAAPACCTSLREAKFDKIEPGASRDVQVSPERGSHGFDEGRSLFAGIELPQSREPYTIHLRSQVAPSGIPRRFRVFVPAVLLLDEQFQVVEARREPWMKATPASLLPPRAAALEGSIAIDPNRSRARYLVLYTNDRLMGGSVRTTVPNAIPIAGGVLPAGSALATIDPWTAGRVTVSLERGAPSDSQGGPGR